jgi:predicted nucleic acid-binding Zn ribbon protein
MTTGAIHCVRCGSDNLRRSHRKSKFEWLKMALGTYPFRCMECNHRFPVNVWFFSRLAFAKCPKCLSGQLTGWPQRDYHLPLWKNLLITFGAHRYRCTTCRHRFLSFRAREHGQPDAHEPEEAAAQLAQTSELESLEQVSQSEPKP